MTVAVLAGLGLAGVCAVGMNLGAVLEYRGANAVPRFDARRPFRSARLLLGSGSFAIGLLFAQLSGLLHIAALALAPISVVQAVLAGGMVLVVGVAKRLLGCGVSRRQRIGLATGAVGLVLLVLSLPTLRGPNSSFSAGTIVVFDAVVVAVGAALAVGSGTGPLRSHRGVLVGAAAGAVYGLSDVAVKAVIGVVEAGGLTAAAPWLAIAVAGGLSAQVLAVRGLQEGDAVPVIVLTGVAVNITNIAGGLLVFGDPVAHQPLAVAAQSIAFTLVVLGAALLPRRAGVDGVASAAQP